MNYLLYDNYPHVIALLKEYLSTLPKHIFIKYFTNYPSALGGHCSERYLQPQITQGIENKCGLKILLIIIWSEM